jgi:APA family basic amino acid/polyamine antiporter
VSDQSIPTPSGGPAGAGSHPGLFLRQATGLVRDLSPWDAFNINFTNTNAFANVTILLPLGLALFLGANLALSVVTGLIGGMFVVVAYCMLAQAMPRSGGDYVFISRAVHPFIGFLSTWTMMILCAFFSAFNAWSLGNWILPDFFAPLGTMTGQHWMLTAAADVSKPRVVIALELVQIALFFYFMYRGTRVAARTQWIPTIFTVGCLVVALPVLLFTSRGTYIHNFNKFAAHYHTSSAKMQAVATHAGANLHPAFSWHQTIAFWPFVMVIFGYAINSIQIGGEVRNPRRTQYIAVIGSTLIAGVILAIFLQLSVSRVPSGLMNAFGYFAYIDPSKSPFPFPLYGHVPLALGIDNPILLTLFTGAIAFGLWGSSIGLYFWGTRYMLAWSFDRVAPPQVAYLSPKRNAPVVALAILTVLVVIFGVMLEYVTNFTYVAGGLLQSTLLFCASVAAILFPFRLRAIYKGTIGWEVGKIPVISAIGVVATVFMGVMVYSYATNATFGTVTGKSLQFSEVVLAAGVIYYIIAWVVARSRGYNLALTYREIPPE